MKTEYAGDRSRKWTDKPELIARILELKSKGELERNITEIVSKEFNLKISYGQVRGLVRNYQYKPFINFAQSPCPKYLDFLKIEGNCIITSDWHCPFYDHDLANKMAKIAEKFGIKKLIDAGDFLDEDAFKSFLPLDGTVDFEVEVDTAIDNLTNLLSVFDDIYFLRGNHHLRLARMTEGKFKDTTLFRLLTRDERVKYSAYSYCILNNTWNITHPKNYSIIPLRVGNRISLIKNTNVINAHGHRFGLTFSDGGKIIIDSGGLFDEDRFAYRKMIDSTYPAWNSGFVMILDNKPYLFSNEITDWDYWLNS